MGRKPKYTSDIDKALATRAWKAKSNRTRKQRRKLEPAYNEKVLKQSRKYYREIAGGINIDRVKACEDSLAELDTLGTPRQLILAGGGKDRLPEWTMTTTQLAPAIGLCGPAILHVWHGKGIFPRPLTKAATATLRVGVYTKDQVKDILTIMISHFRQKNYLTAKDPMTSACLFKAVGQTFVPKLKPKKP